MTQQALPKEILDLHLRLDALERKIGKASIASVPNQNLSQTSDVEFNTVLVGLRGSWVPSFAGTTVAGAFTYSNQFAYHYVISNMVFVQGRVTITAITTPPTGSMKIAGLPYACHATYYGGVSFHYISQIDLAVGTVGLHGYVGPGSSHIQLVQSFDNGGAASLSAASFTNTAADLIFTGFYNRV